MCLKERERERERDRERETKYGGGGSRYQATRWNETGATGIKSPSMIAVADAAFSCQPGMRPRPRVGSQGPPERFGRFGIGRC